MPDLTPEEQAELTRQTAKLMGALFIARKDVKAIEGNGGWYPVREQCEKHEPHKRCAMCNEAPTIPFKMGDFHQHLWGSDCFGTYLLDLDNKVKFIAFDIDLDAKDAQWWPVNDLATIDEALDPLSQEAYDAASGELDITKTFVGNLEEALHDPEHSGYRWGRILLKDRVNVISKAVVAELGLNPLTVITGGGAHVLVPFGELVPAKEARAMARAVAEAAYMAPIKGDQNFWGSGCPSYSVELFPKQDTLSTSNQSFGNLIRLPLGWHRKAGMRTYFLGDPNAGEVWDLKKASGLKTLEAAAAVLGVGD